ncbi:PIN domain-containing protein [Deinococcus marmoris]|uniref:PIN domain-containing protein n=1 Tax=Deinococcus marmoris TaxID=249408 RepID=UPI000A3F40C0|nr:PIN domain-containing protein [Deinococcus marmoris]
MIIILDTNILDSDPRKKGINFITLSNLAQEGYIRIWIPELADQEHISHIVEKLEGYFILPANQTKDLARILGSEVANSLAEELRIAVEPIRARYMDATLANYVSWKDRARVQLIKTALVDISKVMEAYFAGNPPFRNKKSKGDIPDAIMYYALLNALNEELDDCAVVTADEIFGAAFGVADNIIRFKNLDELLESPKVKDLIKKREVKSRENTTIDLIHKQLKFYITHIEHEIQEEIAMEANQYYDADNCQPEIGYPCFEGVGMSEPVELKINDQNAEYIGSGIFLIPISGYIELVVEGWNHDRHGFFMTTVLSRRSTLHTVSVIPMAIAGVRCAY